MKNEALVEDGGGRMTGCSSEGKLPTGAHKKALYRVCMPARLCLCVTGCN